MPRFFFHIYDGSETLDQEGLELPGLEAAIAVATHELRQLVAYEFKRDREVNVTHRIDVAAEDGRVVASVHFDDLLDH